MELNNYQVITSSWEKKNWLGKLFYLPRLPVLVLIMVYRKTISPDHGWFKSLFPYGYCRFQPTCSSYGFLAIEKYGLIKGGVLAIWRILRCNPFSKGGVDELK